MGQDLASSESTQKTTLALNRSSFALAEDIVNNLEKLPKGRGTQVKGTLAKNNS